MDTLAGEGEVKFFMTIYDHQFEVVPAKQAAKLTGYSWTHMCRLCDEGKVFARKAAGGWWVELTQLEKLSKYSQTRCSICRKLQVIVLTIMLAPAYSEQPGAAKKEHT